MDYSPFPPDILRRIDCFVINLGRIQELESLLPPINEYLYEDEQITAAQLATTARDIWTTVGPDVFLQEMLRYLNGLLDQVIFLDNGAENTARFNLTNIGLFMWSWLQQAGDCF